MEKQEFYKWLQNKNYQTIYEDTGEYKMYFKVDLYRIFKDYESEKL